jgi:Ran GTPase-activating protein (RanGAP) involved in mRNA processing and transport
MADDTFLTSLLVSKPGTSDVDELIAPRVVASAGNDDVISVTDFESLSQLSLSNESLLSTLSAQSKDQVKLPSMQDKYFGQEARARFFQRLQFMQKQRNISSSGDSTSKDASLLYFDNEDSEQIDYPFAVTRPTSPFIDLERYAALDCGINADLADEGDVLDSPYSRSGVRSNTEFNRSAKYSSRDRDHSGANSVNTEDNDDDAMSYSTRGSHSVSESANSNASLPTFVSKYDADFPDPSDASFPRALACPLSPRTKFISSCLSHNVNPRSCLILRRKYDGILDLQHLGMGDKLAGVLSTCLGELPYVHELNINNNNLTDVGVYEILKCVGDMRELRVLNLSRNKMDDLASDALADFVKSYQCRLTTLIMQQSDIDDNEGLRLLNCLQQNTSITALDLSENKIGGAESMRASLKSDHKKTCAEAFADFLASTSTHKCVLRSLNLSWNMIRLNCSIALCKCVAVNNSLTELNLSFNSLCETAECLGSALMENNSLVTLNLASCGIPSCACLVLAIGAIECHSLRTLILDSNPVSTTISRL